MRTLSNRFFFLAVLALGVSPAANAALQEMEEEALASISGQALFLADKIAGTNGVNGTVGADALSQPFTYYRIGVDADMALNLNIDKLQLGCGGFNEGIAANSCDMDADFMSMTGTTGPASDFLTTRPYLEIAIKNDGDKTRREIVGVKIGAQTATGIMSIGRVYTSGQVNQEWGGTCNSTYNNNEDNGSRLACHSGANRISGFMNAEMSGRGLVTGVANAWTCFGWTRANTGDPCGPGQIEYVGIAGTRMNEIAARNMVLRLDQSILGINQGNTDIRENLRFLHKVVMGADNKDFYISWQRERLRWPIYDYANPYDTDRLYPIGNNTNGDTAVRSYHFPANTGFWMNIQDAKILDADAGTINLTFGEFLGTLGEGANLYNFNTGQTPADNCFGSLVWC